MYVNGGLQASWVRNTTVFSVFSVFWDSIVARRKFDDLHDIP